MTSLPGSFHLPSRRSLPSAFVESVQNNHVPDDHEEDDIASVDPFADRHSLIEALNHADNAIHVIDVFSLRIWVM